jgi:galactose mutarotase-like enzyme
VYTDPEHAVCVEPQSGPPDEFNLAPNVVHPGTPLVITATFRWMLDG